jgi:hypothetical protein
MSISASSVLVELNISIWTARKLDKKVSEEINVQKNTTANAGNYSKNLLAGSVTLSDITKFASRIRLWHMQQTLPWSDNGTRMLPMKNFMDYKAGLRTREDTLNRMIHNFLVEYPNLVNDAANKLGALFDATEYPDVDVVRNKFKLSCVFAPVPEAGDFRIDAEADAKQALQDQYQRHYDTKLETAMKDQWNRLHDALSHISERMTDEIVDGEPKRKQFRDSVLENPMELCQLLTKMNVTNDPKLEEARKDLERALVGVDVDTLRESDGARKLVKSRMDDILKKFDW